MNFLVVDIETTGLDFRTERIHGVGLRWGTGPDEACYYRVEELPEIDPNIPWVLANGRFDIKFLAKAGIPIPHEWHDVRLMGHLLDENNSTGLKEMTERYLGQGRLGDKAALDSTFNKAEVHNIAQLCAKDLDSADAPYRDIIGNYCNEDTLNTYELFMLLGEKLYEDQELARYYVEEAQPFERVMLDMELEGMRVDVSVLDNYGEGLRKQQAQLELDMAVACAAEVNKIEEELYAAALEKRKSPKGKAAVNRRSTQYGTAFSFASPKHVGKLVYEELGAELKTTSKGSFALDEASLQTLRDKSEGKLKAFLELFASWRGVQKELTTYVDGLKEHVVDGKVNSLYGQYTVTGRTHSSAPNVQNLPRGSTIKRAFIPAEGNCFIYFDYSQIELRIAAHLSQDPTMLSWFRLGIDPHQDLANKIGVERQVAKGINFLGIYDGKAFRLHETLLQAGITRLSVDDCAELLRVYWEAIPHYKQYLKAQLDEVRNTQTLRSQTGRLRRLPDIEFGDVLDWRFRTVRGATAKQIEALRTYPSEYLGDAELFERASRRYSHAKKQAYNFPVQHLGATIMKKALMALRARGYTIVTSVHDSAVIEVAKEHVGPAVLEIQAIAESAMELSVPLKVDIKILASLDEKNLYS